MHSVTLQNWMLGNPRSFISKKHTLPLYSWEKITLKNVAKKKIYIWEKNYNKQQNMIRKDIV